MVAYKPLIAGMSLSLVAGLASAADYPAKDVTMIVPWSAGGGTDTIARSLVAEAEERHGDAEQVSVFTALHDLALTRTTGDHAHPPELPEREIEGEEHADEREPRRDLAVHHWVAIAVRLSTRAFTGW